MIAIQSIVMASLDIVAKNRGESLTLSCKDMSFYLCSIAWNHAFGAKTVTVRVIGCTSQCKECCRLHQLH